MGRNAPRQRFLLLEVVDKKVGMGQGLGGREGLCDPTDAEP